MSTTATVIGAALVSAGTAGGAVYLVTRRRVDAAERARRAAERTRDTLRDELARVQRLFAEQAGRRAAEPPDELAADAFDPVSGLLRERFVAVLIQQRVAAARRRLHPVSVVALEADGLRGQDRPSIDHAMRTLGTVIRQTLREADCACRVGDAVVIAAFDDTTEDGARLAVARVQHGLRQATGDLGITVSAGIASYPSHALEAPDLVARAGAALLEARGSGPSHVATASATTDTP